MAYKYKLDYTPEILIPSISSFDIEKEDNRHLTGYSIIHNMLDHSALKLSVDESRYTNNEIVTDIKDKLNKIIILNNNKFLASRSMMNSTDVHQIEFNNRHKNVIDEYLAISLHELRKQNCSNFVTGSIKIRHQSQLFPYSAMPVERGGPKHAKVKPCYETPIDMLNNINSLSIFANSPGVNREDFLYMWKKLAKRSTAPMVGKESFLFYMNGVLNHYANNNQNLFDEDYMNSFAAIVKSLEEEYPIMQAPIQR